ICSKPAILPSTGGLPYASAFISASAQAVTSNPVQVFIHPQVTTVSLVGPQQCLSQGVEAQLDAQACYSGNNSQQWLLCAPASVTSSSSPKLACSLPTVTINGVQETLPLSAIPSCTSSIGTLAYNVGSANIATINSQTNQITAEQPGTTVITASIAGSGSSAGYFSTCPPKAISLTLSNGNTSGTITQGVEQNLVTTVTDTNGN